MKKIIKLGLGTLLVLALCVTSLQSERAIAQSAINFSSIGGGGLYRVGSSGDTVRAIQTFLASNQDIYPEGLVTGYYGPLTKGAVEQFQLHYRLASDGIVGPNTKAKMNEVIAAGRGLDIYAPLLSAPSINPAGTTATIAVNANEPIRSTLYYSTAPIKLSGADEYFSENDIAGTRVVDSTFGLNKNMSLENLSPNTTYYYSLMTMDASGNVTLTWPSSFVSGS